MAVNNRRMDGVEIAHAARNVQCCALVSCVIHSSIHTYIYTYIHTYIHTYMHTYIHTYINIQT